MSEQSSHQSHRTEGVWLALISAISAIVVAVITNWKTLTAESPRVDETKFHEPADRDTRQNQPSEASAAAVPETIPVIEVLGPHKIRINYYDTVPCYEYFGYRDYSTRNWTYTYFTRETKSYHVILSHDTGAPIVTDYSALIRVAVPLEMKSTLQTKIKKLREKKLLEKQAVRMKLENGVFHTPELKCE